MNEFAELPGEVRIILEKYNAPGVLIRHLRIVYSSLSLINELGKQWFGLEIDEKEVLFGAATHDIGKVDVPEELHGEGNEHLEGGCRLLKAERYDENLARFAITHERWKDNDLPINC